MAKDEWYKKLPALHNEEIQSIMKTLYRENMLTDGSYHKLYMYIHDLEEQHPVTIEKRARNLF